MLIILMFTWLCVFTTTVVVLMRIPFLALDPAFLGCSGWNPRNGCKWVMKQQPYPGQCEDRARCHHCFGHEMEYEEDGRQDWHLVQDIPSACGRSQVRGELLCVVSLAPAWAPYLAWSP